MQGSTLGLDYIPASTPGSAHCLRLNPGLNFGLGLNPRLISGPRLMLQLLLIGHGLGLNSRLKLLEITAINFGFGFRF